MGFSFLRLQESKGEALARIHHSTVHRTSNGYKYPCNHYLVSIANMILCGGLQSKRRCGENCDARIENICSATHCQTKSAYRTKQKKEETFQFPLRGTTRNRTGDTRIFSPLLYQLSYGTIILQRVKPSLRVQR